MQLRDLAALLLEEAGFTDVVTAHKPRGLGVVVDVRRRDATGRRWFFDVTGSFASGSSGLRRADELWRALGRASVLHEGLAASPDPAPLVLLSTGLPSSGSPTHRALGAVTGPGRPVHEVIELLDGSGQQRLRELAEGSGAAG
ncbi:MAG: hypothetical protein R2716_08930 [Microthrixaceae bacterium]